MVNRVWLGVASLALAHVAVAQNVKTDFEGLWIDSQSNRVELRASGPDGVTIGCPSCRFDTSDRVYEVPLNARGTLKNGQLSASQAVSGGNLLWSAQPPINGRLRVRLEIPGVEPMDFAMYKEPMPPASASTARYIGAPDKDGHRVVVELLQASAKIGSGWAPMYVYLADREGKLVAPAKETLVEIKAEGGTAFPPEARITPQQTKVLAGVAPDTRSATVTLAVGTGPPTRFSAIGCAAGSPTRMNLTAPPQRVKADGVASIPVTLTMVDASGTPQTDDTAKQATVEIGGVAAPAVGLATKTAVEIPAGQCAESRALVATRSGSGSATVSYGGRIETVKVSFEPSIRLALIFAAIGGLIGGFAVISRNFAALSRWEFTDWVTWLLLSAAGGCIMCFVYFDVLPRVIPSIPSAGFVSLFAGMVGGAAGAYLVRNAGTKRPTGRPGRVLG